MDTSKYQIIQRKPFYIGTGEATQNIFFPNNIKLVEFSGTLFLLVKGGGLQSQPKVKSVWLAVPKAGMC